MAPFRYLRNITYYLTILCFSALVAGRAYAITAKELMNDVSDEMYKGYMSGLVDMLSYQAVLDGDRVKARCINDTFYRSEDGLKYIVDAMFAFPDKEPVAVLIVAMNKKCGK